MKVTQKQIDIINIKINSVIDLAKSNRTMYTKNMLNNFVFEGAAKEAKDHDDRDSERLKEEMISWIKNVLKLEVTEEE